jgi:hypothetical protein
MSVHLLNFLSEVTKNDRFELINVEGCIMVKNYLMKIISYDKQGIESKRSKLSYINTFYKKILSTFI